MMLYIYYSKFEYAFKALESGKLYFKHSNEFNDVFDNRKKYNALKEIIFQDYEMFNHFFHVLSNIGIVLNNRDSFNEGKSISAKELLNRVYKMLHSDSKRIFSFDYLETQILGYFNNETNYTDDKICCFTTDPLSELMWSHYADKNTGIVLEFDTEKNKRFFQNVHKVEYTNKYDSLVNNPYTKKTIWEYEKEYSLIISDNKKENYYGKVEVEAVIFGLYSEKHTDEEDLSYKTKIRDYCYNKKIKIFNIHVKDNSLIKKMDINHLQRLSLKQCINY